MTAHYGGLKYRYMHLTIKKKMYFDAGVSVAQDLCICFKRTEIILI